eukprot:405512-Amphidinium_carterae.1
MPLADSGWWSLTRHSMWVQEHGAFTVADFPVVECQSSTTHSMYVVVVNKLDAHASLQDLVVAIEEDLEMPALFKLHNALPPHDCQYCIQQSSETEWQLIRFFTFVRRAKLADVRSACGDCTMLVTCQAKDSNHGQGHAPDCL